MTMKNLYPILLFLSIGNMLTAQVKLDLDTLEVSKAEYSEGDPWQILSENIDYPLELAKKYIQGDVIISLIITKNGTIDSIKMRPLQK